MPGSPTPPNLNTAPPSSAVAAQSIEEAPPCDWTSTMTTATGPASAPVNAPTSSNKRRRDAMQQDIAGRDYYNNLKQSELIDLVVKLQEQNLILTRLLERSTLTAAATSSAPANSNARLNLTPNVNFTRTKSGSAASRYASETDFPTLNNNAGTKKGSATATANTDNNATTTKKSSGSNKKASKNKTKVPTDAAEAKKWALRLFTTPTAAADANDGDDTQMSSTSTIASSSLPPPGYTCVYLPCGHKTKHAELRTRLQILKINLKRVYAIQRPAKHVVSLLVHSHYAPEILKICEEDGLNPITDFDPISGKNLGDDPNLTKTLNAQQLDDKARVIYDCILYSTNEPKEPFLYLS
ncbi:hypothetical protein FB192DRAFT_1464755 [Mucor lusitanicus]|uniref:Uncharacterized protein n=1 Tax=Mucor circinelloides f. lusitanicus TaxID=29924 RepID=A0A8H4BQH8_MUCCL|nr:hypothetical protein FB192DRAFT_1464755 [Mucor lusitanicus]